MSWFSCEPLRSRPRLQVETLAGRSFSEVQDQYGSHGLERLLQGPGGEADGTAGVGLWNWGAVDVSSSPEGKRPERSSIGAAGHHSKLPDVSFRSVFFPFYSKHGFPRFSWGHCAIFCPGS